MRKLSVSENPALIAVAPPSPEGNEFLRFAWRKGRNLEWKLMGGESYLVSTGSGFLSDIPACPDPADFRNFAALETEPAEILAFAQTHGPLGVAVQLAKSPPELDPEEGHHWLQHHPGAVGEALSTWHYEIHRLRNCLRIWDALRAEDWETLRDRLRDGLRAEIDPHILTEPLNLLVGRRGDDTDLALLEYERGNLPQAARWLLGYIVTDSVEGRVAYRIRVGEASDYQHYLQPINLLGYYWWCAAQLVSGGKQPGRCSHCGKWFSEKPKGRGKKWCGDSCKSAHHNAKRSHSKVPVEQDFEEEG